MKELVYEDLDKVCRGCLAKNGEMRPLFGSSLDDMLRAVAEIEVMHCIPPPHFLRKKNVHLVKIWLLIR